MLATGQVVDNRPTILDNLERAALRPNLHNWGDFVAYMQGSTDYRPILDQYGGIVGYLCVATGAVTPRGNWRKLLPAVSGGQLALPLGGIA